MQAEVQSRTCLNVLLRHHIVDQGFPDHGGEVQAHVAANRRQRKQCESVGHFCQTAKWASRNAVHRQDKEKGAMVRVCQTSALTAGACRRQRPLQAMNKNTPTRQLGVKGQAIQPKGGTEKARQKSPSIEEDCSLLGADGKAEELSKELVHLKSKPGVIERTHRTKAAANQHALTNGAGTLDAATRKPKSQSLPAGTADALTTGAAPTRRG
jgi:hypothetical protein